ASLDTGSDTGLDTGSDTSADATPDVVVDTGGPDVDAASDADGGCPPNTKLCGPSCVSTDDPATGCAAATCNPCSLPNATATCSGGACAIALCTPGFDDCDSNPATGCEIDVRVDVDHCGACNRACSGTQVEAKVCAGGLCVSSCTIGSGNCSTPTAISGPDN